jgi:hypothetical protein
MAEERQTAAPPAVSPVRRRKIGRDAVVDVVALLLPHVEREEDPVDAFVEEAVLERAAQGELRDVGALGLARVVVPEERPELETPDVLARQFRVAADHQTQHPPLVPVVASPAREEGVERVRVADLVVLVLDINVERPQGCEFARTGAVLKKGPHHALVGR